MSTTASRAGAQRDAALDVRAPWTPRWREPQAEARLAALDVCVLYGGRSGERDVSLTSGRTILEHLQRTDGREGPKLARVVGVEVDAGGRWIVDGRALSPLAALSALPEDAVFFLGLHGGEGEDGRMQAFLEIAGRVYTGAGQAASCLCMDKHLSRLALAGRGLAVAPGRVIERGSPRPAAGELAAAIGAPPWFVKPVHGGSSVATSRVEAEAQLAGALDSVRELGDDALVERAIVGLEVSVGVVGNRRAQLRVLPPIEILPRQGPFFDYREKYSAGGAIELCPAQHLSAESEAELAERARVAYLATGCDGYARVDMIVPMRAVAADSDPVETEPVLLEVNTLPGFTPRSLLPSEARAVGVEYRSLCLEVLYLALELRGGDA